VPLIGDQALLEHGDGLRGDPAQLAHLDGLQAGTGVLIPVGGQALDGLGRAAEQVPHLLERVEAEGFEAYINALGTCVSHVLPSRYWDLSPFASTTGCPERPSKSTITGDKRRHG